MTNPLKKLKLLKKILELEKTESNDFQFAGKVRNLIDHFKETGEIKDDPKGRRL
tara:strand:+ start:925 stop:1086 length:162 start_codon:yes stop_codon:yes gene_type:complete